MKIVLDPCCGERVWTRKSRARVVGCDLVNANADVRCSMTRLPFHPNTFDAVRCDPPHLIRNDVKNWNPSYLRYGHWKSRAQWTDALLAVGREFHRVTRPGATLLMKIIDGKDHRVTKYADLSLLAQWWNEAHIVRKPSPVPWSTNTTLWVWFRRRAA